MVSKRTVTKPVRKTNKKRPVSAKGGSASGRKKTKRSVRVLQALPVPRSSLPPPLAPVASVVPTTEKHLTEPNGNRLKLWLAVSVSMAVIVVLWAYSLSQSVLTSNTIEETLANSDIDEFVSSVGSSLSELKTNSEAVNDNNPLIANTNNNQPTTEELDNLFSDIE